MVIMMLRTTICIVVLGIFHVVGIWFAFQDIPRFTGNETINDGWRTIQHVIYATLLVEVVLCVVAAFFMFLVLISRASQKP